MADPSVPPVCHHNRWRPTLPRCTEPAVWQSVGVGWPESEWTWCLRHAPNREFRAPIAKAASAKERADD